MKYTTSKFYVDSKGHVEESYLGIIILSIIALAGIIFMFIFLREAFIFWLPFWIISFFIGWVIRGK